MPWIEPSWIMAWRSHRSVLALWLVAVADIAAMVIVAVVRGFGLAFYLLLTIGILLELLHQLIVKRLEG